MGWFLSSQSLVLFMTMLQITAPLINENPTSLDTRLMNDLSDDNALLPAARFTPRTLLGAGSGDREMMGHLYASHIATAITNKNPDESRALVLGLGLPKVDTSREHFLQIMELVLLCI